RRNALRVKPKERGKRAGSPSKPGGFEAHPAEIPRAPADLVNPESPANPLRGAGSSSPGRHGGPARDWRRPLLGFVAIGAVGSASIAILLFIHPGGDKAVSIGTPAREDAAEDSRSAREMAARP